MSSSTFAVALGAKRAAQRKSTGISRPIEEDTEYTAGPSLVDAIIARRSLASASPDEPSLDNSPDLLDLAEAELDPVDPLADRRSIVSQFFRSRPAR